MLQSSPHLLVKKNLAAREHIRVPVTRLASGANLGLSLHVATGEKPGPTLGILTTIHGDETFPLMAVRELLASLDLSKLSGRVAAIPVANPLAVSIFGRQTPEQHGKTDLHEVFPGNGAGNVTQRLAYAIARTCLTTSMRLWTSTAAGWAGGCRTVSIWTSLHRRKYTSARSVFAKHSMRHSSIPTIWPAPRRAIATVGTSRR